MGYDGEQPVIEIPVMLTEYEIMTILKWFNERVNSSKFEGELANRISCYIVERKDEDLW